MKKNLLWMFAALVVCGAMMTSCSKEDTEIIPIDQNQGQNQGKDDDTPLIKPVSVQVKYEASASQTVMDNYNLVGTAVLVRYVDADGKVKSEPFTGTFAKNVTIPITSAGMNAALQVLIVPKSKEEIEALGTNVDVTTNMKFTCAVNYSDKSQSEDIIFSTSDGFCAPRPTVTVADYDRYVPRFGGYVPAMVQLGYYTQEVENHISVVGPTYDAASFWRENAYTGQ
jgi:hypothetical protein